MYIVKVNKQFTKNPATVLWFLSVHCLCCLISEDRRIYYLGVFSPSTEKMFSNVLASNLYERRTAQKASSWWWRYCWCWWEKLLAHLGTTDAVRKMDAMLLRIFPKQGHFWSPLLPVHFVACLQVLNGTWGSSQNVYSIWVWVDVGETR